MKKYLLPILLIGFWGCEDDEESPLCDSSLTEELKSFADENWTLNNWVNNRFTPPTHEHELQRWTNFEALTKLTGTHDMKLIISGDLANELNITRVSSDSLEAHPEWFYSGDVTVVKDRHFYENIGKYDQFVGGWDDEYDNPFDSSGNWFSVRKKNVESIILTKRKDHYRDIRYRSNSMKHYSKYAVSSIMINHLISALDAQIFGKREEKNIALSHFNISNHGKIVNGVKVTYMW